MGGNLQWNFYYLMDMLELYEIKIIDNLYDYYKLLEVPG